MRFNELLEYREGVLYWRKRKGKPAGYLAQHGYLTTRVDGKLYYNHRIIWYTYHGYWPRVIDHIDRNPLNNLIENLRNVTQAENTRNSDRKLGKTGLRGVWVKGNRFQVVFSHKRKRYCLGSYVTSEEAAQVYKEKHDSVLSV